jgi:Protein kinase domain
LRRLIVAVPGIRTMSKPLEPAQATSRTGPDGQPIQCEETVADEGAPADRPVLDETVVDPEGGPKPDEAATINGIADAAATTARDSERTESADTDFETVARSRGDGARVADFTRDRLAARVTTVAGYEILGELGRGSMGVVYQARQRGLTRVVALKMNLAGAHCRPEELARFRNEAVAVAELQHPNIVQLYEVGEDDGQPFFSLEYVDGLSLAKKINGMPQPLLAERDRQALRDGGRARRRPSSL